MLPASGSTARHCSVALLELNPDSATVPVAAIGCATDFAVLSQSTGGCLVFPDGRAHNFVAVFAFQRNVSTALILGFARRLRFTLRHSCSFTSRTVSL